MSIGTRIGFLTLSASTLALAAQAEPVVLRDAQWIYGVQAREAADVDQDALWLIDYSEVDSAAERRPTKQPAAPPAPAPAAAPTNTTGAGILVAIVDTGIDLDHSEFKGRIAAGGSCFGAVLDCAGVQTLLGDDNNGHGTHVAGIVAAASNGVGTTGVAPGASLLAVKVLNASGSGSYSSIANGLSYATTRNARVINMSLGGSSGWTGFVAPLQQAAAKAVIVVAAGNGGNALAPSYPAQYATQAGVVGSMIIVGSVSPSNVISSFSQTPGTGGCVTASGVQTCFKDVFLVAPGQTITSTYNNGGYASMSGTSMATPYVSGVAARVLGAAPYLTPKQVVSILLQSATDLGVKGTDAVYGRGLVNLTKALQPIGTQSIATSGGTTSSYSGTGSVQSAGLAGVLSAGLKNSQIAKSLTFFDAFGRDYQTDLSNVAGSGSFSLSGIVGQRSLTSRFVSAAGDGFSMSGFVSDQAPNSVAFAGFMDQPHTDLNDVVVTAKFGENTTVTLGHDASLTGRVNQLDLAASEAYDGLFMSASAMNSPFLALTNDATFLSAAVKVGDGLTFSVARAEEADKSLAMFDDEFLTVDERMAYLTFDPTHQRSAENTMAAMTWQFAPWGVAGFNAAYTEEENSFLGGFEQGALALTSDAATTSFGVGVRLNLGDDWVASASWSRGMTEATPASGSLFQAFSNVESEAYGVAISKLGVFGEDDSIGFAVSRPLHITGGTATITASTGVTEEREILYTTEVVNLASSTPETDYEVGYTAKLSDSTTLQANALYQQDVGGESGKDGVAGYLTLTTRW